MGTAMHIAGIEAIVIHPRPSRGVVCAYVKLACMYRDADWYQN